MSEIPFVYHIDLQPDGREVRHQHRVHRVTDAAIIVFTRPGMRTSVGRTWTLPRQFGEISVRGRRFEVPAEAEHEARAEKVVPRQEAIQVLAPVALRAAGGRR